MYEYDESKIYELSNPISPVEIDLQFSSLEGEILPVTSISMNNGIISSIEFEDPTLESEDFNTLVKGDFTYAKEFLEVPGIGFIPPETVVRYKEKDYLLLFGWHKNISNQVIYSWFLSPIKENKDCCNCCHTEEPIYKTVYFDMINEIESVRFLPIKE